MPEFTAFLVAIGPLAIGVTKATDFIRNAADWGDTAPKWVWNVVPFALGIGFCMLTAQNLVGLISGVDPEVATHLSGVWGQVATGISLGATASFWHEHLDSVSQSATLKAAEASESKVIQADGAHPMDGEA